MAAATPSDPATAQPRAPASGPALSAATPVRQSAPLVQIFALFAAGYFLSYCFRTVGPLIAPDLMRELRLDAGELGLLASVYFLTFAIAQPFIGILMDRHGPAKVNAVLLTIAACGGVVLAMSANLAVLTLGRAMIGLGVSGALMTSLKAFVVWYPPQHREALSSSMMAVGGVAAMLVSIPAELAMRVIGWRGLFWGMALASVVVAGALWVRLSRMQVPQSGSHSGSAENGPAGLAAGSRAAGTHGMPANVLAAVPAAASAPTPAAVPSGGFAMIFRSRIFIAYAPLAFFSSGGFSALQSLWAGPWLIEVAGRTRAESAEVLFAYGLALFFGYLGAGLISGRLQALPGAPRAFYMGGLALAYVALAIIISNAWPASSAPWFAYGLTLGTGMLAYPALTRVFPVAIAGRVMTAYNVVMFAGAFVLQWGIGALIQAQINHGVAAVLAYQVSFAVLLAAQVVSLVWFWGLTRELTREPG